ncbi:MAG: hypothetical protein NUV67_05545 [archaeon]|nr:hypothetical protein [archaeon]
MAISRVNGVNADYIVELSQHPNNKPIIKGVFHEADAFALELSDFGRGRDSGELPQRTLEILEKDYKGIIDEARENNKSVWHLDVDLQEGVSRREFLKFAAPLLLGGATASASGVGIARKAKAKWPYQAISGIGAWIVGAAAVQHTQLKYTRDMRDGKSNLLRKIHETTADLIKTPTVEGRSALFAEKVDGFVAKEMARRLGRRPIIYIWMGMGHITLPKLLSKPPYRQRILNLFRPLGKTFASTILTDALEISFQNRAPKFKYHNGIIETPKPMPRRKLFRRLNLGKRRLK